MTPEELKAAEEIKRLSRSLQEEKEQIKDRLKREVE